MSFQMRIDPRKRVAASFIGEVRDELLKALIEVKTRTGITQSEIAKRLGVHRSVINRELSGQANLTLRRVAEIAWALNREPVFRLDETEADDGGNFSLAPVTVTKSGGFVVRTTLESGGTSRTSTSAANEL